jgi:hypothetical protein
MDLVAEMDLVVEIMGIGPIGCESVFDSEFEFDS